jgi:hypothetical protein
MSKTVSVLLVIVFAVAISYFDFSPKIIQQNAAKHKQASTETSDLTSSSAPKF